MAEESSSKPPLSSSLWTVRGAAVAPSKASVLDDLGAFGSRNVKLFLLSVEATIHRSVTGFPYLQDLGNSLVGAVFER